jgi:hypothetical protein
MIWPGPVAMGRPKYLNASGKEKYLSDEANSFSSYTPAMLEASLMLSKMHDVAFCPCCINLFPRIETKPFSRKTSAKDA